MEIKESGENSGRENANAQNGHGEGAARNGLFLRLARLVGASGGGTEAAGLRPRLASRFEPSVSARSEWAAEGEFASETANESEEGLEAEGRSVSRAASRASLQDSFAEPISPRFAPTDADRRGPEERPRQEQATRPIRAQVSAQSPATQRPAPDSAPRPAVRAAASDAAALEAPDALAPARATVRRDNDTETSATTQETVVNAERKLISVRATTSDSPLMPSHATRAASDVSAPQNPLSPAVADRTPADATSAAPPERRATQRDNRDERRGDLRPRRAESAAFGAPAAAPAAPAPIIQVTIGRIEVRAASPPSVRTAQPALPPAADDNLTHYLRRRDRR